MSRLRRDERHDEHHHERDDQGFFERLRLAGSEPWSSSGRASISPMVSVESAA